MASKWATKQQFRSSAEKSLLFSIHRLLRWALGKKTRAPNPIILPCPNQYRFYASFTALAKTISFRSWQFAFGMVYCIHGDMQRISQVYIGGLRLFAQNSSRQPSFRA
jgi:hypothetical protein